MVSICFHIVYNPGQISFGYFLEYSGFCESHASGYKNKSEVSFAWWFMPLVQAENYLRIVLSFGFILWGIPRCSGGVWSGGHEVVYKQEQGFSVSLLQLSSRSRGYNVVQVLKLARIPEPFWQCWEPVGLHTMVLKVIHGCTWQNSETYVILGTQSYSSIW